MDVNLMNKINIGLDLFQMEQLDHLINEVKLHPDKHKFIMDDIAFKQIEDIINNIKQCYGEALDDIGFTVQDHFKDKLDYPDTCDVVVDLINVCYNNKILMDKK